jgi:phosphoribosylanthranilate isomerase
VSPDVKICGITDEKALQAAIDSGASYAGFVFYPPSPRALDVKKAAALAAKVPAHVMTVGLLVDPTDDDVLNVTRGVSLGMLQLHGKETPARVAEIRNRAGLPVMKAIGIGSDKDFAPVKEYEAVADMLLFDAKPSKSAALPGGNAESFDWSLLKGREFSRPWLLAGGINADNLADAVRTSGARGVDVSSGVEDRPGHKNPDKIRALLAAARDV